jgi:hypothetical protein
VLLAPRRPDHAGAISVEFLADLYRTLRLTNDYVIVDTPPGFTPEVIASIDSSSYLCMLGMLDSLALKNTKLGLETLELMGYPSERISLVLEPRGQPGRSSLPGRRGDRRAGARRADSESPRDCPFDQCGRADRAQRFALRGGGRFRGAGCDLPARGGAAQRLPKGKRRRRLFGRRSR